MKTAWLFIIVLSVLVSCQRDDVMPSENLDFPIVERLFCEASPEQEVMRSEFEYSPIGLLKNSHFSIGGSEVSESYTYNDNGNIEQKVRIERGRVIVEEHEYSSENQLQKIHSINYDVDSNGVQTFNSESELLFEYENGLLVKETAYWGGFKTYEYSGDQLVKMTSHNNNGNPHHITQYKYKGDLLKREVKETREGNNIYTRKYCYDGQKRLESIIEDREVIEEYIYEGNRLVRKNEWYYGIDPGYSSCNGNYITLYEY